MVEKKQTRLVKRTQMYIGIYNEYILPCGKPTTRDLISKDSLEWDNSGMRRRKRSEMNQGMLLNKLWATGLDNIQKKVIVENSMPIKKMIQKYLDSISLTVCKSTVKQYTACLDHFVKALGDFDLDNLPDNISDKFLKYLELRGISDHSINSYVRMVQSFFIWCNDRNYIPSLIKLGKKKPTKTVPLKFSEDQLDSILDLIEKHILDAGSNSNKLISALNQRRAFYLFRYTGARAGEIRTLPLDRISLNTNSMMTSTGKHQFLIADVPELGFRVKGKHEAFIPIAKKELLDFLSRDLRIRNINERWFLDDGTGQPQWNSVQTFGRVFDTNLKKLGIKGKRTHGFRATVISNLLNKGTPAVAVQMLARHADLSTTLGYFNQDDNELRKHIEANL